MSGSATFTIEVTVNNGASGPVTILCSPDPATVKAPNTLLIFRLKTPGWAYAATQPIVMVDGSNQFPLAPWTVDPHCVTLLNLVTVAGSHKYIVNLVKEAGGEPLSVDPVVINEPF